MGGSQILPRTVYVGTFLHSTSLEELERLERTAIGVDENGVIAFIEKNIGDEKELKARIHGNGWDEFDLIRAPEQTIGFWFPGFIDTHIHAPQFPNAGIFGKSTLLDWLETYTFPLESSLGSLTKARTVYRRCVRTTLSHGTTTAAYFATVHVGSTNALADICLELGQRAFIGRCNMDEPSMCPAYYRDASATAALTDTKATIEHIDTIDPGYGLIAPILTPRFALSCTPPLLKGLGELHASSRLRVQTHIAENPDEVTATLAQFPQHSSYAAIYADAGLLSSLTVLAHAIHLSPAELALVVSSGAAVSHCPISNTSLGSGICPVRELLDAGIPVGLGTDVSGGYSPSILAACREAGVVSRLRAALVTQSSTSHLRTQGAADGTRASETADRSAATTISRAAQDRLKLSVEETLHLATRGGARCLGLAQRVGGFDVGMEWDAQFIDLGAEIQWSESEPDPQLPTFAGPSNAEIYADMGWSERLAKWVFCGDERNTRAVWVRGRLVSGMMR